MKILEINKFLQVLVNYTVKYFNFNNSLQFLCKSPRIFHRNCTLNLMNDFVHKDFQSGALNLLFFLKQWAYLNLSVSINVLILAVV